MLDCPKCHASLPLFREASCRKCGADLSNSYPTDLMPADKAAADRTRAGRTTLLVSIIIYAILMISSLNAEARFKAAQAFGAKPLGLPLAAFFGGLITILYVPMAIAFYHFALGAVWQ